MKIIFGLGNPGERYKSTRHNAGFLLIDQILEKYPAMSCSNSKFKARICEWHDNGIKVLFVKPETYMNESGSAVSQIMNFYNVSPNDILIVHDEIDLPVGQIRVSTNSSAAGHNGIKSIIQQLGTQDFIRLRIGIENRESRQQIPTEAFVLQPFSETEIDLLQKTVFPEAEKQVLSFVHS